jgi:hypothetical protein
MSEEPTSDPRIEVPQPETITQSFTIACTIPVDAAGQPTRDAEGNILNAVFSYAPAGPGITPDDCIALCAQGIQWVLGERARLMAKAREQKDRRIIVPGRGNA